MIGRHDKPLFTPGPLTTSGSVKQAMLHDLGTRDHVFKQVVREVRHGILDVAGLAPQDGFDVIPMQGCGTMGIEAVLSSVVSRGGHVLVLVNGAYGRRIATMVDVLPEMRVTVLAAAENETPDLVRLDATLSELRDVELVVAVHCETTSGILNPVEAIGRTVAGHGRRFFIDSMSAFGGVPFDLRKAHASYLVSSANKCIEGVPGFSFVIADRSALEASEGAARTLSLDLLAQLRGLERDGQFLYTPPVQVMLAFRQALRELQEEGGVVARHRRYTANHRALVEGMRALGFETWLPDALQGPIITTFRTPDLPGFDFQRFYDGIEARGHVIYGGKTLNESSFRIGTIGRLDRRHVQALLLDVRGWLEESGFPVPIPSLSRTAAAANKE